MNRIKDATATIAAGVLLALAFIGAGSTPYATDAYSAFQYGGHTYEWSEQSTRWQRWAQGASVVRRVDGRAGLVPTQFG